MKDVCIRQHLLLCHCHSSTDVSLWSEIQGRVCLCVQWGVFLCVLCVETASPSVDC